MGSVIRGLVAALVMAISQQGLAGLIIYGEDGPTKNIKFDENIFVWLEEKEDSKNKRKKDKGIKFVDLELDDIAETLKYNWPKPVNRKNKGSKGDKGRVGNRGSKGSLGGGSKVQLVDVRCINHGKCNRVDVPEPGTVALLGIGILGVALSRRRFSH